MPLVKQASQQGAAIGGVGQDSDYSFVSLFCLSSTPCTMYVCVYACTVDGALPGCCLRTVLRGWRVHLLPRVNSPAHLQTDGEHLTEQVRV